MSRALCTLCRKSKNRLQRSRVDTVLARVSLSTESHPSMLPGHGRWSGSGASEEAYRPDGGANMGFSLKLSEREPNVNGASCAGRAAFSRRPPTESCGTWRRPHHNDDHLRQFLDSGPLELQRPQTIQPLCGTDRPIDSCSHRIQNTVDTAVHLDRSSKDDTWTQLRRLSSSGRIAAMGTGGGRGRPCSALLFERFLSVVSESETSTGIYAAWRCDPKTCARILSGLRRARSGRPGAAGGRPVSERQTEATS